MFSFPIFEAIEKWCKEQGSWVYWVWLIFVGCIGAVSVNIWMEDGLDIAKPLLIITCILWFPGAFWITYYENKRKENLEKEANNESSTDKSK